MTFYDLNMNSKSITNLTSFSGSNQSIVTYGTPTVTTAGKLYYLNASNDWIEATNSNSASFQLAIANGASSSVDGMIISGKITNATYYSAFSVGGALYVSSTSGLMTNTAPSSNIRSLGNSLGSNQIFFSPSNILSVATGMSGYGIASGAATTGFTQTTITDPSNSLQYSVLKWTDSATAQVNTMNVTTAGLFEIFLMGGGGGGGTTSTSGSGGAGGAGELLKQLVYLDTGAWTINVGQGGNSGSANTQSGARGFSSQLVRTTPVLADVTSPKFIATGGGGGMTSSTVGNVPDIQWRLMLLSEGVCCGGGAGPYANATSGVIYSGTSGLIGPQTFQSLVGFGQNPSTSAPYGATTGNFLGGLGGNDSNVSASGGGGGLAGAGGDATATGGASQRGGPSGRGIIDGFSGINIGYGGGGGGGHGQNLTQQITDNTGASVRCVIEGFTISGTTLTVTAVQSGTIELNMRVTGYVQGWTSSENLNAPSSEVYISAFGTGSGGNGTYTLSSNAIGNIVVAGTYNLMYLSIFGEGQGTRNVNTALNYFWSGSAGAANSGAGGAGNGNQNNSGGRGGAGGSGVVMVRYRT